MAIKKNEINVDHHEGRDNDAEKMTIITMTVQ